MLSCENCGYCLNGKYVRCPFYKRQFESQDMRWIEKVARKEKEAGLYWAACLLHGYRTERNERKAKAILEKLSRDDYIPAKYVLSLCYFHNPMNPKIKLETAIKLCEEAAEGRCNLAAIQLYHCYNNGNVVKQDFEQAGKWCKQGAENGSEELYFDYAEMCCTQKYGIYNLKNACDYFERLVKNENDVASERLKEVCYEYAESCYSRKDSIQSYISTACIYYEKSLKYGNDSAYEKLVELHENHLVDCYVDDNNLIAGRYDYVKKGDFCLNNKYAPNAKIALGIYRTALDTLTETEKEEFPTICCPRPVKQSIYFYSVGETIRDIIKRMKKCYSIILTETTDIAMKALYEKAVAGDATAQFELAGLFENKEFELYDIAESVDWYRLAAKQGDASAQDKLGYCYLNGHGIEQNYIEAVKWYRLAAEQGDVNAQSGLGYCYLNGYGIEQNYIEAAKWYRLAAEQGYANAQSGLGYCYLNGYGIEQNYIEAAKWYRLAAEQGYANAQSGLGYCYAKGYGIEQNYIEAIKWYRLAAEQGYAYAQYSLGVCYMNGEGVSRDYCKGKEWFSRAAQQKYPGAEEKIKECNIEIAHISKQTQTRHKIDNLNFRSESEICCGTDQVAEYKTYYDKQLSGTLTSEERDHFDHTWGGC